MLEQERTGGIVLREVGREIVDDEHPTRIEEVERGRPLALGSLLEASAVEEEQLERPARRELEVPVAEEDLHVREVLQAHAGEGCSLVVVLDGDERASRRRERRGALPEGRPRLGTAPVHSERGQQRPDLRDRRSAARHPSGRATCGGGRSRATRGRNGASRARSGAARAPSR